MDFPSFSLSPIDISDEITQAIGVKPLKAYMGADMVCVLENEEQIKQVIPNLEVIRNLDGVCLHITARGSAYDCVTRSFAPKCNVAEDPVCSRGHCHVIPFWASELGKKDLGRLSSVNPRWCVALPLRGRADHFEWKRRAVFRSSNLR